MKNSYFYYCLFVLVSFLFSEVHAQQTFRTTSSTVIGYFEYLPQDYNTNSDKYPIVIFLHGLGERGTTSNDPVEIQKTINRVNQHGPPKYTQGGTQFPFILISPQLSDNYGDWPIWYVNEVIDYCKTYLRIDERRIYLTGLSLGGGGTWSTAQDFPKTFAAIAPVCGSRNSVSKACNIANENLPVWAFHGDVDTTVPKSRSIAMVSSINACTPAPNPLAKITIYPGVSHNAWDNAYKPDHTIHNPNVYEWMLSFTNVINGNNKIPIANAGSDISQTFNNVTIVGSGSDVDGNISSYSWSQLSGPSGATLTNASMSTLTASNLVSGVYIFKLRVTDNGGDSSSDYVKVLIQQSSNIVPIANAGADATIVLPTNSITLAGSGSDSDGTISSFAWTKVSGAASSLSGTTSSTLTASSLTSGAYIFRLTVTDNLGATKSDDVNVNVSDGANALPIANAGIDRIITLPNTVTLFGSGSDSDGTIASYNWVKISGGSCTFTCTTVSRPKISNFTLGTYVFRLTVVDNKGASASDDVIYTTDYPPVANAGLDYNISLPTNSITLNGSATDADGSVTSYAWSLDSGPSCTLKNRYTASVDATNLLVGTYVFKLIVTDNVGITGIDYATVIVSTDLSGRSITNEQALDSNDSVISSFILGDSNIDFINSAVVIYNASGSKIYEGKWNGTLYNQIFNKQGLYYYKIVREGKQNGGKVYITESF